MSDAIHYRGLAWMAALALFMQTLDATILNTALPAISASLNESPLEMQFAVISYALTVALLIPLSGWLADKYGTLVVFRISVAIFVLGSIACALASSLNFLIMARIIQGIGGALMMPVARLSILRTVPKNHLLSVWNLMAMAGLLGPILGPILGGWLVTYTTWQWIFLINIPIGLIGIVVASRYMPNAQMPPSTLDWKGFILFATGLAGMTLGLDLIADQQSSYIQTSLIFLSGLGLLIVYVLYARKVSTPLLPLSLFRIRTFSIGIIANLLIRLCGSGVPFLLPLMFQVSFGYSPELTGWLLAPIALSSVLAKPLIAPLLKRIGYKNTLLSTALCLSLSIVMVGMLNANTAVGWLLFVLSCYGACMSVVFTVVNTLTVSELSQQQASAGSTMLSVAQQMGIGIGIAVSAVILGLYRSYFIGTEQVLQTAFHYTYFSMAMFGLLLIAVLAYLKASDGEHLAKPSA